MYKKIRNQVQKENHNFQSLPQEDGLLKGAPSQCVPDRGVSLRHD